MRKTIIALAALTTTLAATLGAGSAAAQGVTFADIDADKSGELSYSELSAVMPDLTREAFAAADTDGNGSLSQIELQAMIDKSGG